MSRLDLRAGTADSLACYVGKQVDSFFPDPASNSHDIIQVHISSALERLSRIISAGVAFQPGRFDHFNSIQYAIFIYLLANEIWLQCGETPCLCERLFLLNKALSGVDLYYKIKMPEFFLLGHGGSGTVFVNTVYGNRLVVFNNVTIGRFEEDRPVIGEGVILFPNTVVSGNVRLGDNVVISAGTTVINQDIPSNSIVFPSENGLLIKKSKRNYLQAYFRQNVS